jgi:hypothetical protein
MDYLLRILSYAAAYAILVVVHELGHWAAARAQDVPGADVRIRVFAVPPHVAFKSENGWSYPNDGGRYAQELQRRIPKVGGLFVFAAAGIAAQTLAAVLIALVLPAAALDGLAFDAVVMSAAILAFYVIFDPIHSAFRRHASGDISALWVLSPPGAIGFVVAIAAIHAGLIAWVW